MPRQTLVSTLAFQFPNPVQPPQWGAPVIVTHIGIVTDDTGAAIYQPSFQQMPAVAEDITDELLAALQRSCATLGLVIDRLPAAEPAPEAAAPEAQA